ncbi:MAG TPA: aldose 1-epimerase [Alphaproteobacteria bacterium]
MDERNRMIGLDTDRIRVELAPAVGGAIARFDCKDAGRSVEMMRGASVDGLRQGDPRAMASFPMIPYCGRIRNATFGFDGHTYTLARNFGDAPVSIHGNAWQRSWAVEAAESTTARLRLEHDPADAPGEWPFRYRARQSFAVSRDMLEVTIELTNLDRRPMPAGFGLHPYFPCTPEAKLTASVAGMWESDASLIPKRHVPIRPVFGRVADLNLDACFTGWNGRATIEWPERSLGLEIEADPVFGNLVVYTPPNRDFFCVEPESAVPDAFNLAADGVTETGAVVLAPGETCAGRVRFRVVS